MASKPKMDMSKDFARITSGDADMVGVAYSQEGWFFTTQGEAVKKVPGWENNQAAKAARAEKTARAEDAEAVAARAENILGDLGGVDPHAEAARENQSASAAEQLSDDAA